MLELADAVQIVNTFFTGFSAIVLFMASILIPIFTKRYNVKKTKITEGEAELQKKFEEFMNDKEGICCFEWYVEEVRAIQKRFAIKGIYCLNCHWYCGTEKYMNFYTKHEGKITGEHFINNFSFRNGSFVSLKKSLSCLKCYKCYVSKKRKKTNIQSNISEKL